MSQHSIFKNIFKILLSLSVLMSISAHAQYKTLDPNDENDPDAPRFWEETEVKIPTAPPSKDLKPFYVSATTQLKFALDAPSIAFGHGKLGVLSDGQCLLQMDDARTPVARHNEAIHGFVQ